MQVQNEYHQAIPLRGFQQCHGSTTIDRNIRVEAFMILYRHRIEDLGADDLVLR